MKLKRMLSVIMDGVKDHVVPHIIEKKTTNAMWTTLTTMYQGKSVQKKMLLENQMRLFMMTKGEEIDPFLFRLQAIRDQLIAMGLKVEDDVMVRIALNVVIKDWETLAQSILVQTGTICGLSSDKRKSAE